MLKDLFKCICYYRNVIRNESQNTVITNPKAAVRLEKLAHHSSLGPWLWIICISLWFVVQYVVASAWSPGFSLLHNSISDLGNTACGVQQQAYICSPLHSLFNLTLVIVGLLLGFGAILIFTSFPHTKANSVALVLLCASGFGTSLVGLVPENVSLWFHSVLSATFLIVYALGVTAAFWVRSISRPWRRYSLISGFVASAALLVSGLGLRTPLGFGGLERIADYTLDLWIIGFGIYMLKYHRA